MSQKEKGPIKNLIKLLPYFKEYRLKIGIIICGSILFAVIRLIDPFIYKIITDDVFVTAYNEGIGINSALKITLWSCGLLFFLRISTSLIFAYYSYLSMEISNRLEAKMFRDALKHLQSLDVGFHNNKNSGEILSRVDRGIDGITRVLHEHFAKHFLPGIVNIVCLLIWINFLNWKLAVAGTFFLPFHLYLSLRKARPIYTEQTKINRLYEKIYHRSYEAVQNILAVISFNRSNHELSLFDKDREMALIGQLKIAKWWRVLGFSASFFEVLGRISILILGTVMVVRKDATPGEIIMFLAYISMLYQPLLDMITMYLTMQQELSKANRLTTLMEIRPQISDSADSVSIGPIEKGVILKNVSFRYSDSGKIVGLESSESEENQNAIIKPGIENTATLSDINLVIKAGQKIAIVGPTGSGKSTLASIIQRHYDPDSGSITVDGVDIQKIKLKSLRQQVTNVPQQALLFSRTIEENIGYGKENATDDDIIEAAKIANAHEFITLKPKGYKTAIGEKGVKLSGGEQQRISIARAIVRDASLIIMDEATSHLDAHSESLVQSALWKLLEGKTAIIIAHRLSTILHSDSIVVLDNGTIVDQGTHEELLSRCGLYKKLYEHQFNSEFSSPQNSIISEVLEEERAKLETDNPQLNPI